MYATPGKKTGEPNNRQFSNKDWSNPPMFKPLSLKLLSRKIFFISFSDL